MSHENVEAFRRMVQAYNRRDVESFLEGFDPSLEWRPLTQVMFGGETRVYRGYAGVRQFLREVDEAFADIQIERTEIRDLGERIVVSGHLRARGRVSGVETTSPIIWLVEFKNGKVSRMRDFLDPKEALEAAGLSD